MTDDIAAVPASHNEPGYGEAVSDEEFSEWVTRSQADTERVIAEWDNGVEFHEHRTRTEFREEYPTTTDEIPRGPVPGTIQSLEAIQRPAVAVVATWHWHEEAMRRMEAVLAPQRIVVHQPRQQGRPWFHDAWVRGGLSADGVGWIPTGVDHVAVRRSVEDMGLEVLERSADYAYTSKLVIPTDGITEAVRAEFGLG